MSRNVWIIIPAFEEEEMIGKVIEGLKKKGFENILVIDDGSEDRTADIAESKDAEVVKHEENRGLGAAIRTGLDKARSKNADIVITFDADGQHDPAEVQKLIDALEDSDFVVGVRDRSQMPLNKRFGNAYLDYITHLFGGPLTDSQSGLRGFGKKALEKINIYSNRYSVSSEIILQVGEKNLDFGPVPIKGIFTDYSKASGTTIASGVRIFLEMMRLKLTHWLSG